jgi:hypothetical protein
VIFTLASATNPSWTVTDPSVVPPTLQSYSSAQGGTHALLTIVPAPATQVSFNSMGRICFDPAGTTLPTCTNGIASANTLQQITIQMTAAFTANDTHPLQVHVNHADGKGIRLCDASATLLATDARHC